MSKSMKTKIPRGKKSTIITRTNNKPCLENRHNKRTLTCSNIHIFVCNKLLLPYKSKLFFYNSYAGNKL